MSVFFTSDTHLRHANILGYCRRPFKTAEEMDEAIIGNWNRVVKPGDQVYHLGDLAFVKTIEQLDAYLQRLNGQVFLIEGNHDRHCRDSKRLAWVKRLKTIVIDGQPIVLCHYAMRVWDRSYHGSWHLYGHSHGALPEDSSLSFDIGVDSWGFTPVSLGQIKAKMAEKLRIQQSNV